MTAPLVDIIATGSGCAIGLLAKGASFLTSHNMTPRYSKDFFEDHPLYICSDKTRFLNLKTALYASDSHIIWCLRGGSGTSRLLSNLLPLLPPPHKKILLGFSDVTALHLFLTQKWGWQTIHGPTLNALTSQDQPPVVTQHLITLLKDKKTTIQLPLTPLNNALKQTLTAPITGGNLSLLQLSLGTPWHIDTTGKILFIEDINEAPYRVAEKLTHLKNAGIFQNVTAILFGDFSRDKPERQDRDLMTFIIQEFADSMTCPVFKDFSVGHIQNNYPVQLNAPATLLQKGTTACYEQHLTL